MSDKSEDVPVEQTEQKKRGRPRKPKSDKPEEPKPKRPRGRPPITETMNKKVEPPKPRKPRDRPRQAAGDIVKPDQKVEDTK